MTYVKADVDENTHKQLRLEAAEYDMSLEEVTAQILQEWANNV